MRGGGISLDANGCNGIQSEGIVSVNGSASPASLNVPAGTTQLLRIVNATSDSPKVLKLRDSTGNVVPMHVVELDGIPVGGDSARPLGRYLAVDRLMLAPAARASVLVSAAPGETLTLSNTHYCEGADAFFQMPHELLRIRRHAGRERKCTGGGCVGSGRSGSNPRGQTRSVRARTPVGGPQAGDHVYRIHVPKNGKIPVHSSLFHHGYGRSELSRARLLSVV